MRGERKGSLEGCVWWRVRNDCGHFFHIDTALLRSVAFLRCKLSRREFLFFPLGLYQTWGEGLGVCMCLSSWVQFSVNHKGSRSKKPIVRIKDSCRALKECLTAQIVPMEFKGKRGSSGRPMWAYLFIFRVSMAPRFLF